MKLKNIIQNIGANLLITILGLVGSIILARWLGPGQRGVFAAIILIPSILQYFVNFGLSSATIFFTAQTNADKHKIWSSISTIAVIQSIIGFVLGWYLTDFYLNKYPQNTVQMGRLYLGTIPLGLFGMYATYMLQGASYFRAINILKCIVPTGYCLGIIVLKIYSILSLQNLVYLQLLIQFGYFIFAISLLYKLLLHRFLFIFEFPQTRTILHYGVKVWFGDISQLANSRIDQFLIGALLKSHDLGIYTVAVSVAGFSGIFANAVRTIIVPTVTGKTTLPDQIKSIISFFKAYWIFSLLFHLIFLIIVPVLIPFVFGKAYEESVIICQILIVGSLFINAKTVLSGGVQAMGFPEIISLVEFIGMVISLLFCYFLIKTNGLIGISIAIAFAYWGQFIILIIFSNQKGIFYKELLFTSKKEINYYLRCLKKVFYE